LERRRIFCGTDDDDDDVDESDEVEVEAEVEVEVKVERGGSYALTPLVDPEDMTIVQLESTNSGLWKQSAR